jgi:adenylate kinase
VNILILGPQGSGKGTQARRIAAEHDVSHVATGDILRGAIDAGTELGRRVEPILERGALVPDDLMIELIRERLEAEDRGFVLDGFPRTVVQAEALDAMLERIERRLDIVLLLDASDGVVTGRMLARAAEEGRSDDTPEVIARRLGLYHELTEPVVEHYRAQGNLAVVDGEQSIVDVEADIRRSLAAAATR